MKKHNLSNIVFITCLVVSLLLMIGGAVTPPPFIIDGSILQAAGILMGFAVIAQIPEVIRSAKSTKVQAGENISIEIEGKD